MGRALLLSALLLASAARAVEIEVVPVRDAGNPCEPFGLGGCFGAVGYDFYIGKYEVTNAQYAEFLNAVAGEDPKGLYNPAMGSDPALGGISRAGAAPDFSYTVKAGFENKPVTFVSFWDVLRFANWLHNGQPSGGEDDTTTEDGAYTITDAGISSNDIVRTVDALVFLPSEDEWVKAAYYDPALPGYHEYSAGSDEHPSCVTPASDTGNSGNCSQVVGGLTEVGAYSLSDSPYATFDQGGNVSEWNEAILEPGLRGLRGGDWFNSIDGIHTRGSAAPSNEEYGEIGFRVATLVPEPGQALLALTGVLVLLAGRASKGRETRARS